MLYWGFIILPRSVIWSADFNGRSDNLDVIPLAGQKCQEQSIFLQYRGAAVEQERNAIQAETRMSLWYFYIIFIVLLVSENERKRRQMKPRVLLEPEAFNQLIKAEQSKVIRTTKIFLRGHMYVTEGDSFFYYSYSKEPLTLPEGTDVIDAKLVNF